MGGYLQKITVLNYFCSNILFLNFLLYLLHCKSKIVHTKTTYIDISKSRFKNDENIYKKMLKWTTTIWFLIRIHRMHSSKILTFHHKFLISSPPREYRISPPAAVVSVREICSAVSAVWPRHNEEVDTGHPAQNLNTIFQILLISIFTHIQFKR